MSDEISGVSVTVQPVPNTTRISVMVHEPKWPQMNDEEKHSFKTWLYNYFMMRCGQHKVCRNVPRIYFYFISYDSGANHRWLRQWWSGRRDEAYLALGLSVDGYRLEQRSPAQLTLAEQEELTQSVRSWAHSFGTQTRRWCERADELARYYDVNQDAKVDAVVSTEFCVNDRSLAESVSGLIMQSTNDQLYREILTLVVSYLALRTDWSVQLTWIRCKALPCDEFRTAVNRERDLYYERTVGVSTTDWHHSGVELRTEVPIYLRTDLEAAGYHGKRALDFKGCDLRVWMHYGVDCNPETIIHPPPRISITLPVDRPSVYVSLPVAGNDWLQLKMQIDDRSTRTAVEQTALPGSVEFFKSMWMRLVRRSIVQDYGIVCHANSIELGVNPYLRGYAADPSMFSRYPMDNFYWPWMQHHTDQNDDSDDDMPALESVSVHS